MKKLTFLLTASIFSFLFVVSINAQNVIEGEQLKGYGTNATLSCTGLDLKSNGAIYKVEGLNEGFWITNANGVLLKNFTDMDDAIGYKLTKGTYYIYPNLKKDQSYAWIRAYIK